MKSLRNRRKTILASLAVMTTVVIVALLFLISRVGNNDHPDTSFSTETARSIVTVRSPATPGVEPTPGLIIYGLVHDQNGAGVEDVLIYRNYASYPGELIATTDASGYYESDFYAIPGDEMVGVWAERSGFGFEPQFCRWRHYYGYEQERCDFLARQP